LRFNKIALLAVLVLGLNLSPSTARAGEATEQLRSTINDFVAILSSTPVSFLRAHGLPESARRLVFARFDFSEMTRRSLGSHWGTLNKGEQSEFVEGLTRRLLVFYGKTMRSENGDEIYYKGEVREGEQVKVVTQIVGVGGEALPVDYRLHDDNGQWKVYDVVIDHVSMVNNYRAQFERVIARSSLRELLRRVKSQDS